MNKSVCFVLFVGAALSSQSASLWYTDFSELSYHATKHTKSAAATPGIAELSTNATYQGTWYRKTDNAWGTLFSMTNGVNNAGKSLACPQDCVGAAGLRTGYHGQNENYQNFTEINTGLGLDITNLVYTLSFRARVQHRLDASTNLFGTGAVTASWGWWNSSVASNNFKWFSSGATFSNLVSDAWVTNAISFVGPRVTLDAANAPLIVRFTQKGPQNTQDFETWVDWINIDGQDRYVDWATGKGLSSMDKTADEDLDGIDNFTEWATGGDPKNPADRGLIGDSFIWDNNGTNILTYLTPRQTNYWSNGIDYYFEGTDNLMFGSWTNIYPWEWKPADEGGFNPGFNAVSNYFTVSTSNDTQFIRLRAGHRGYHPGIGVGL